jgi:hypothetical protein
VWLHLDSWLYDASATFSDIPFGLVQLGFEFVSKLKFVFEQVLQPITQSLLVSFRKLFHSGFDLLKR